MSLYTRHGISGTVKHLTESPLSNAYEGQETYRYFRKGLAQRMPFSTGTSFNAFSGIVSAFSRGRQEDQTTTRPEASVLASCLQRRVPPQNYSVFRVFPGQRELFEELVCFKDGPWPGTLPHLAVLQSGRSHGSDRHRGSQAFSGTTRRRLRRAVLVSALGTGKPVAAFPSQPDSGDVQGTQQ